MRPFFSGSQLQPMRAYLASRIRRTALLPLVGPSPIINVASDGEGGFHPFGVTVDTSDAIQFTVGSGVWIPDPAYSASFGAGLWQELLGATGGGTGIWVLPSTIAGCASENEPTCEPIAKWDFSPGGLWPPDTDPYQYILESDGVTLSDVILLDNSGPNGSAAITFSSDPSLIPEENTKPIKLR